MTSNSEFIDYDSLTIDKVICLGQKGMCYFCNHKFKWGDSILHHYIINHHGWIYVKLISLGLTKGLNS